MRRERWQQRMAPSTAGLAAWNGNALFTNMLSGEIRVNDLCRHWAGAGETGKIAHVNNE
jgi:hypothetical protein